MAPVPSVAAEIEPAQSQRLPEKSRSRGGGQSGSDGSDSFFVRLDQYAGPLDALLDLVRKQRIDILDLPIAQITEQYLDAVRAAEELDVEVGAEFVLLAATLVQIKSKMLLPRPPVVDGAPTEDPRQDLVQSLLEREKFLQAAEMLREKRVIEESVWTAGGREAVGGRDDDPERLEVSLYDLVRTFGDVLDRLKNEPVVELPEDAVSVAGQIQYLKHLLLAENGPVSLRRILWQQRTPRVLVATFLALLELVKASAVALSQDKIFGEIIVRAHTKFDEAFRDGGAPGPEHEKPEYST